MLLQWIDPNSPSIEFPPVSEVLDDPEGLLAAGGDLRPERLLHAYRNGIFPWYEPGQPILWWCPDPRAVIYTDQLKISRSLRKSLRNRPHRVSFNTAFNQVIRQCAAPRSYTNGTWITADMQQAYGELHRRGHAHSVEIWNENDELVGGLYGILLPHIFCGESMFSRATDMSKLAMVYLCEWLQQQDIGIIDCQMPNAHLMSLGAVTLPRDEFLATLRTLQTGHQGKP